MIFQDRCQLCHGQVRNCRANTLESRIVWCKHRHILSNIQGLNQVGPVQGTKRCRQPCLLGRVGNILRDGQNSIDHVDHSPGEIDILWQHHAQNSFNAEIERLLTGVVTVEF